MATAVAGTVIPYCRYRSSNNTSSGSRKHRLFRIPYFSADSSLQSITKSTTQYRPNLLDNFFLHSFRSKMAKETRWDSDKPGYDGLIEVANRLMIGRSNLEAQEASIRILKSLFPPLLLKLYTILISPLADGKLAAVMVARVTALSCKWLMGPCEVNDVTFPDGNGTLWRSTGVFVERCKYLEESKCVGICVNTCKLPTQRFFKDYMGVPLVMEPNFNDYSCQFKFGVLPQAPEEAESTLKEPCLQVCPYALSCRESVIVMENPQSTCPKL